jgi:GT2 family glycosyltransferase/glycosyltransferase involved in cell wall biosynthesis
MSAMFVSYSGRFGGAERLLLDCAPALDGERVLACPPGPLADAARAAGLRVIPLREHALELRGSPAQPARAALRLAAHGAEARRLVRDLRPELLIAWGMRSAIALAGPLGDARPARTVFQHNDLLPGPGVARAVRAAAARYDRVIALSETVARDLDPGGRLGDRLAVCHPGVDLARFVPLPPAERPGQALVLGAIVDWKRPDLALDAAALAAQRVPSLRLRLAGGPLDAGGEELLAHLRERAARPELAGRVDISGPADAAEALREATCLLHCADSEPFGLVVLEALASARPVIAPAAGGPAELLDDEVGRLYPPGDAAAAADRLAELLGEPGLAARLGEEGRRRAEERHGLPEAGLRWRRAVAPPQERPGRGEGLALVTVTHDSARDLEALLGSVRLHLPLARVVIVDSGSSDDSVAVARAAGERVQAIELGENVGYGRATNLGLEAVTEPVAAIVNPDVELLDDSLAALAAEAGRSGAPERILAPLVLLPGGGRQDSVHPLPASAADLTRSLLPDRLAPPLAPWRSKRPRRVGWAVGCCLVAPAETLRRLGPFDERIFMYAEDLDLGVRAGEAGIETWFWPSARVLHKRAQSSERAFGGEPFELLAAERRRVVARRLGPRAARVDDAAQLATFASRAAVKRLLGRPAERERRQLETLRRLRREPPA